MAAVYSAIQSTISLAQNWRKLFDYNIPLLKKEHLDRTYRFYENTAANHYPGTLCAHCTNLFAPFVAGVGRMNYSRFITFNVIGGVVWVAISPSWAMFLATCTIRQTEF